MSRPLANHFHLQACGLAKCVYRVQHSYSARSGVIESADLLRSMGQRGMDTSEIRTTLS